MAWVLGITSGPHDSGACLLRGGELMCASNEERFSRRKHDGCFPKRSIEYCMRSQGIAPEQISIVAHGWLFGEEGDLMKRVAEEPECIQKQMIWIAERFREVDSNVESRLRSGLRALGVSEDRLRFYDHHSCHAAAAFFSRPPRLLVDSRECCCITLDGRGDLASGKIIEFDQKPVVLDVTSMFDSLGMLWAFVTAALGFKAFRHEGKIAGSGVRSDVIHRVSTSGFAPKIGIRRGRPPTFQ